MEAIKKSTTKTPRNYVENPPVQKEKPWGKSDQSTIIK